MTEAPPSIPANATVADAAAKLAAHNHTSLPVIDAEGRYVGMFGIYDLLGLLAPRVALAGDLKANLRFIAGDHDELRLHYGELKTRCVSEAADRNALRIGPDASATEAIRLCCRSQMPVPVIEKDTGKVLGLISCWDAMRALTDAPKRM
jgi:CBS domain-containing protein